MPFDPRLKMAPYAANRPLEWGLQDVIDSREAATADDQWDDGTRRKKLEELENNYFTDAPWLRGRGAQQVQSKPMDEQSLLALQKYLAPPPQQTEEDRIRAVIAAAPAFANSPVLQQMLTTARRSNPQPQGSGY